MAVSWFIGPYARRDRAGQPHRFWVVHDFMAQAIADAGGISQPVEILGDMAVGKVRASLTTIQAIAVLPNVDRINKDLLDESLADLTALQKQRLKDIATGLGYTLQEIQDRFPNDLGTYTLRDVLRFLGKRWRPPRWNGVNVLFDTPDRNPPATVDVISADQMA